MEACPWWCISASPKFDVSFCTCWNWHPASSSYLTCDCVGHRWHVIHWVCSTYTALTLLLACRTYSLKYLRVAKNPSPLGEEHVSLTSIVWCLSGEVLSSQRSLCAMLLHHSFLDMLVEVFTRGMVVWFCQFSICYTVCLHISTFFAVSVHNLFLHAVLLSFKRTLLTSIYGLSNALLESMTGKNWIKAMVLTASLFPFLCFSIGFALNTIAIFYRSLAAIPFGTMVVMFVLWAFISFPLVLLGTVVGRNWSGAPNNPCRVKTIPRPIPEKKWYLTPSVISLMGGLLPFGSIFIEMYFVFTSFWNYKVNNEMLINIFFSRRYSRFTIIRS